MKTPKVYTPVTALERRAIDAICPGARMRYPVASPPKRFAREVQAATELTDAQRKFLWRIVWTFRRQVRDAQLVAHAERLRAWAARDSTVTVPREVPAVVRVEPPPAPPVDLPLFDDGVRA